MYFLTGHTKDDEGKTRIACYGTSFQCVDSAIEEALSLRKLGLCHFFNIGCYKDGKFLVVYDSNSLSDKDVKLREAIFYLEAAFDNPDNQAAWNRGQKALETLKELLDSGK